MKFRQYIPVKATSGGGSNPDPSVYCPANGYIPDPEVFHPEFPLPESTVESIIFICNAATSNWLGATHGRRITVEGTSIRYYELYDTDGNLLDDWTSTDLHMDFNFPANDRYYVVKIYVLNGIIDNYYNYQSVVTPYNYCVEAAIFNTPNIKGINFKGNLNFKQIDFRCSLNSLNSFYEFVKDCIQFSHFKFPQDSFPYLQRLDAMFKGSGIKKIDLTNIDAPNLLYINSIAEDCKYLDEFHFMPVCYAKRAYSALSGTTRLRKLTMYLSSPNMGEGFTSSGINNMFLNSAFEGDMIFPVAPYATSFNGVFQYCGNFRKIKIEGDWSHLNYTTSGLADCTMLEEAEMPPIVNPNKVLSSMFNNKTNALKIYKGPDIGHIAFPLSAQLISITGDNDTSGFSVHPYVSVSTAPRNTLTTLHCPKLRCQRFLCGTSAYQKFAVLNSLEIDWANSDWSSPYSPTIAISAAIDATEINRIFTALPVVTGKTINVMYCDGYATCDPSIATAKGWTVL